VTVRYGWWYLYRSDPWEDVVAESDIQLVREALENTIRTGRLRELAKRAKSQAASPDYDEEAIRYLLWALVDAVLADDAGEAE
jgi:hypothetical protein